MRWASLGHDRGGRRRVARAELGVQRRRAALRSSRGRARAIAGGDRRAQVELGERRAQVEAGAADDDRAPPGGEQAVDLGVRAARVLRRR